MVEVTECIKDWIRIPRGKEHALLSGVFKDSQHVEKAMRLLGGVVNEEDLQVELTGMAGTVADILSGNSGGGGEGKLNTMATY